MQHFDDERRTMLEEHLGKRGIRDPRVLEAMAHVPREIFVGPDMEAMAYADRALPIGHGQTISQPYIVALTAQALELAETDTVLEVGVGSGYMAAVLARLAGRVIGVELVPALAWGAMAMLREIGADNVDVHIGDGRLGWPEESPYDAAVVSAAAPEVPEPLLAQMAEDGRLVMPLGYDSETQELTLVRRQRGGEIETRHLCPCRFVPLVEGNAP